MKIAYLFDSGSNYQLDKHNDCFVVPMIINVRENEQDMVYLDDKQLSRQKLERIIDSNATISTSQPAIGQVLETIETIYKSYDKIIAIPFNKSLSSTFNCILNLQQEFGGDKFLVADTNAMSITGNWFLMQLQEYIKEHNDINQEQLDTLANNFKTNVCGALIVMDTKRLIAGGRLKGLKGLIAKTLKLKLIIKYKNNLEFSDKSLHLQDAIDKTLAIINKDCNFTKYGIKRCSIMANLASEEENNNFTNYVIEKLNIDKTKIEQSLLPGCVICHTGCNTFSILVEANKS